ncbi:MAG TPA: hypothetical protein VKZ42_00450 [Flavobacteriaceae bacterium]|nr:hypothetical protein [Flavobacteriaceae bacterium]
MNKELYNTLFELIRRYKRFGKDLQIGLWDGEKYWYSETFIDEYGRNPELVHYLDEEAEIVGGVIRLEDEEKSKDFGTLTAIPGRWDENSGDFIPD